MYGQVNTDNLKNGVDRKRRGLDHEAKYSGDQAK
jgi:hypothetical protein